MDHPPQAAYHFDGHDVEKNASSPLLVPYEGYLTTARADDSVTRPPGSTTRQRFLRAFVWMILFILLFPSFLADVRRWIRMARDWTGGFSPSDVSADDVDGCISYASWSMDHQPRVHRHHFANVARTSFELPVSSELLYFTARSSAALARGSIEVDESGDVDSDVVKVDVSAYFNHQDEFVRSKVCLLRHAEDEHGIGIFAPAVSYYAGAQQQVMYDVKVRLPSRSAGTPLPVKHFLSNLPVFDHHVGNLEGSVQFNSFTIKTSNADVKVEGMSANRVSITTWNRPIEGTFRASSSISLHTLNAHIDVDVSLLHDNDPVPIILDMMTSNGGIEADVNLVSTTASGTGGTFRTIAATSNGPLRIAYPSAPVDSTLLLDGRTTNGPISATLHKTYEGSFSLSNSASSTPAVDFDSAVEDPAHEGRTRDLQVHRISTGTIAVEGQVMWQPSSRRNRVGWTRLTTTNAPLEFKL